MEVHVFLIQLVLILFTARILGEIASFFHIPAVIGEIAAGILIGPSLLGLVEINTPIHLLAQIGIILLLFEVGIETDVARLSSAGIHSLVVAIGGVVFPFILGFFLSYSIFHFSLLASLFIGSTLTATSIGITLRVLRDLKKQNTHESQIIIGAAVIDDIIGIVLLALLYEFSISGSVNFWNAAKVLLFIILFFLIAPIAAKLVTLTIKKWDEKSNIPGLLPTTIVSLILLFAWIAQFLGAPELLGGFAAGLALSRQFFFPFAAFLHHSHQFSQKVEDQMKPIIHLFTPIFFVAIGLSLNLKVLNMSSGWLWGFSGLLLLVAIIGKLGSGFLLWKQEKATRWIVGSAMIPRGEVGLIFASVGLSSGVLSNDIYAALIIVIALTTLLAPFSLKWLYGRFAKNSL